VRDWKETLRRLKNDPKKFCRENNELSQKAFPQLA
jgi:hypothetical protein